MAWVKAISTRRLLLAASVLTASLVAANAQDAPTGLQVVSKSGDWTTYAHAGPPRLCFVLSAAKEADGKGPARSTIQVFVSAWPGEGVRSEVSLMAAAPFRNASEVSVTIGPQVFRLFTQGNRAWVGDATQELKLLEAMRKGSRMVVQAVAEKGVQTNDGISLAGLGQALQALTQSCK